MTTSHTDMLKSAQGYLDIATAWRWNQFQILDWLEEVVKDPLKHGIDSEYVDQLAIVAARKHSRLRYVVEYIRHLRYHCLIADPGFQKWVPGPTSGSLRSSAPVTTYLGYELPVRTLYDAIGWILSITAVPASGRVNQNNFFLPLLGLFGKWCSVLLPIESIPAMLHVSYWYDNGRLALLLGATPGADQMLYDQDQEVWHKLPLNDARLEFPPRSAVSSSKWSANKGADVYWGIRGCDIIARRQEMLEKYGMVIDKSHKIDRDGHFETRSGVGRCAETFIYLWMLQRKKHHQEIPSIRGFALDPKLHPDKASVQILSEYSVDQFSHGLREPCKQACQNVMMPYFCDNGQEKCLFKLEHMDTLENGQNPSGLGKKKKKH